MNEWFSTLDGLWAQSCVSLGAAKLLAFATVSADGWPEVRTVVPRTFDPETVALDFHTDAGSDKLTSLTAHPRGAFVLWDDALQLQIRLQGDATVLTSAQVQHEWDQVPEPNRLGYGKVPTPGTPITGALDYDQPADQSGFAVVRCQLQRIDVVHLGAAHRRAGYARSRDWSGQWLVP